MSVRGKFMSKLPYLSRLSEVGFTGALFGKGLRVGILSAIVVLGFTAASTGSFAQDSNAVESATSEITATTGSEDHAPVAAGHDEAGHDHGHGEVVVPSPIWVIPFVLLLFAIAIFPLMHATEHWWEHNSNRLLVAVVLASVTLIYYWLRGFGYHHSEPGTAAVLSVLNHAIIQDYIPFIVLLFSLFVISGGISVTGDVPAHPKTNTAILALGGLLASFIGTTGAAMLLIRPLLQINQERQRVVHTVVFFIFIVCNIGGCLLPIGDPPLFLGYLRGVPFLWTLHLVWEWALCLAITLTVYYFWDKLAWSREKRVAIDLDETFKQPIRVKGQFNFLLLVGVVFAVALLVPGKELMGWTVPNWFPIGLREYVQLGLAALSLILTSKAIREANKFNFHAIGEVAALFIGIFITMQVPIEILNAKGAELGLSTPDHFFWATGFLSSFLDNAPTYVVFFQTAGTLHWPNPEEIMTGVQTASGEIPIPLLTAVSLGSVFMGAMTYIGNGPNFMVKSIAEQAGVKMPSFFGYMLYSIGILIPIFILISIIFL